MESLKSTLPSIYSFLLDLVLSCPLQSPFPHPASRKGALLLTSPCPHVSAKKKRQPATSYGSSKTRCERSSPWEKHLFLPFPYTSLGAQQRVTPTPRKELMLLRGHREQRCTDSGGLTRGNQEQGMQVTKHNQIPLFDLPLPSRRFRPCLSYHKPEHGIGNRLCRPFQPSRPAQALPSSSFEHFFALLLVTQHRSAERRRGAQWDNMMDTLTGLLTSSCKPPREFSNRLYFSAICWFIFVTSLSYMADGVLEEKTTGSTVLFQSKDPPSLRSYFYTSNRCHEKMTKK